MIGLKPNPIIEMAHKRSRKNKQRTRKTYGGDWAQFWNTLKGRMETVPHNASASAAAAKNAEADAHAVDEQMKAIEIAEKDLSEITANVGQLETDVEALKQLQLAAEAAAEQADTDKSIANAAAAGAKEEANRLHANSQQKTKAAENAALAMNAAKAANTNSSAKKAEADAKLVELEQLVAETSRAAKEAERESTAATAASAAAIEAKAAADAALVVAAASSDRLKGNANVKTAAATKAKDDADAKAAAAAEATAKKEAAEKKKKEAETARNAAIAKAKDLLRAANAAANIVKNSAATAASVRLVNQMNQMNQMKIANGSSSSSAAASGSSSSSAASGSSGAATAAELGAARRKELNDGNARAKLSNSQLGALSAKVNAGLGRAKPSAAYGERNLFKKPSTGGRRTHRHARKTLRK